jgi:hypothetical protein
MSRHAEDISNGSDRHKSPVVIVIGSGVRRYREYLLAGASSEHALWLLDRAEPSWQQRYLAGFTTVDVTQPEPLIAAAREVAARVPVVGVFSYDEALILPTAHVAEALGLLGPGVAAVQRCRDKAATRAALRAAGLTQPASSAVSSVEEAAELAGEIGFPVVLKPRGLGASQGVVRVDRPSELPEAWAAAAAAHYPGVPTYDAAVLVEEYLEGEEISIDAAVLDGPVVPLTLARKRLGPPPFFEETGHTVSSEDPLLANHDVIELLNDTHAALGLRWTMTHTEMRLTPHGPRIIEVNGRLGGDLIPYLGGLASGIDHGAAAVQVAIGKPVIRAATRQRTAGVRFACPDYDGVVKGVRLPEWQPGEHAAELVHLEALVRPGDVLRVPPHGYVARYAMAIAVGPRAADVDALLDSVARQISVSADPAPPPASVPTVPVP